MSIIISSKHRKIFFITLFGIVISLYFLEGVLINPIIFWVILPIYFGLLHFEFAYKQQSKKKLYSTYGFLIASIGFSYIYHLSWYFGDKFGSTSSVIFVVFPIYAIIIGYVGYFLGSFSNE